MKATTHALTVALASLLALPLCHCGSDDASDPGSSQTAEVQCWLASPGDGTVIDGQVRVEVGFSGPVDTIELLVDGVAVDTVTTDGSESVTFEWTAPSDATYSIAARANPGSKPVETDAVSVIVDTLAPVVSVDLPRLSVVDGEVEVPYTLTEANLTKVTLKTTEGVEIASAEEAGGSMTWNTAEGADGVQWLQIEATDAAGHTTLSETVPAVVVNNGEEVEVEYTPAAEVSIPENYASVEYHTRVMATAKEGIRTVITWVTWDDPSWKLEYSTGQGFCPHRGIQYVAEESNEGEIILSLARTDLPPEIVAKLDPADQESETFPVNDDPATFGSFFGHVDPLEPADHVNQSLPVEVHYVFLY